MIDNTSSLLAGIQSALMETWRQEYPVYKKMQEAFLHYLPYTNIRKAPYAFKERIPFPKPWPYRKGRTYQGLKDRKIEIGLIPYELSIGWDERDASDDQLGDLKTHVSQATKRFLQLPDVLVGEYMIGTSVYNYDGLALCYDGADLYATTDGDGVARFGVTGGNIITGSGTSTTAAVMADIIDVRERFLKMQEPVTGQPLHDPDNIVYKRMRFVIPPALDGVFMRIKKQATIYTDPSINTAESNLLVGEIEYSVNQRLTDVNDWFVVIEHAYWKPFAYRAPNNLRQIFANMQNSDKSRETAEEFVFCDLRLGLGPWCPFTTIKVSNS